MYLFGLFDIGKSALFASQTALNVTAHNIANVNTPGFSRQDAILQVSTPATMQGNFIGGGVNVYGVRRQYDNFLQSQLLGQYQNYGRSSSLDEALSGVEQIFNEANGMGLSGPLSEYFNAWQDLSANPEGKTQREAVLQKASALVAAARQMESGITSTLRDIDGQIEDLAVQINSIATEIAALNDQIVPGVSNDLSDRRDYLMNQLGELTEFSSYESGDGSLTITVGMRNLVQGSKTNALTVGFGDDGSREVYLDGIDISSRISKGRLGGLLDARDTLEANQLKGLRKLVASLVKETNLLHRNGFGLDGTTGSDFFAPLQITTKDFSSGADMTASITDLSQLTLNEYEVTFDGSGNYHVIDKDRGVEVATGVFISGSAISFEGIQATITGSVAAGDTFSLSPVSGAIKNFGSVISDYRKIAAAGGASTLPGDNTNALEIVRLSGNSLTGLGGTSFMEFYKQLVSGIGSTSRAASDSLKFDETLLTQLQDKRESVSGVSLDEEAANLIKFQRSFEAGARMIQVTDELLQTILNL